jgi:hypothetical protein
MDYSSTAIARTPKTRQARLGEPRSGPPSLTREGLRMAVVTQLSRVEKVYFYVKNGGCKVKKSSKHRLKASFVPDFLAVFGNISFKHK